LATFPAHDLFILQEWLENAPETGEHAIAGVRPGSRGIFAIAMELRYRYLFFWIVAVLRLYDSAFPASSEEMIVCGASKVEEPRFR